jgi:parallel beta-helix repeat protein
MKVRQLKTTGHLDRPVRICIGGGRYEMSSQLVFTHRDSGLPGKKDWLGKVKAPWVPVTYCAYKGERPVLSGGRRIRGFKPSALGGRDVWVARVQGVKECRWNFHQLWVNGGRRQRTRLPNEGFYSVDRLVEGDENDEIPWAKGQERFHFREGDIRQWSNLEDVEVVVHNMWVDSHAWLKAVDEDECLATLDRPTRNDLRGESHEEGAQYVVENVFESLEEPGQWYLDRPSGRLYYIPLPGEDIETAEVIAARLSTVLRIEGASLEEKPVEEIHFDGLTFSHTEWHLPEKVAASNQASNEVPGAIQVRNARGISFDRCNVSNVGTYAIECEATADVRIKGCTLKDLGAGGIKVWHGSTRTEVSDNEIGDGGKVFRSGVGVLVGRSSGNRVIHNHIHDFDYTGVSVGWLWGYGESAGYGNVVEYNHIHDIGRGKLSDMGGIYHLGVSPGTRLRYNLIHDVCSRGYGGWGIYLDEGSSCVLVENNLCFNTKSGGFILHYGRQNVVRNNIFAYAVESQLWRHRAEPDATSFLFERNIVLFDRGKLWVGDWSTEGAVLRNNLYHDESGDSIHFPSRGNKGVTRATFAQWQGRGLDEGSVIADPRFVDAGNRDFRLRSDSPAVEIDFVPFDLSGVGPRGDLGKGP